MYHKRDGTPAGIIQNWDFRSWNEDDIKRELAYILELIRKKYDEAGNVVMERLNFYSFLIPILEVQRLTFGNYWWYGTLGSPIVFPKLVGVKREVRDAAAEAGREIDNLTLEMSMRKDIFERMIEYRKLCDSGSSELDPEYLRFVDRMITVGKSNGLQLKKGKRNRVKSLKSKINYLTGEFEKRLIEDKTVVLLSEKDLAGLSEDFIKALDTDARTGLKKLTMSYPTYLPVMRKCRIPDTRREMFLAYNNRGGTRNEDIMKNVIELRHECANLLGYENWAAYRQELYMAKKPETVDSFLKTLSDELQPLWKKERETFLKLKEEECKKYGYKYNGTLEMWDFNYYCNMLEETEYLIDIDKLKEFFPLDTVTKGLLGIYSHILALEFKKMIDPPTWHDDVFAYKVKDKLTREVIGYVYMDLFPREGKYSHFANKPLQSGACNDMKVKQMTVTCMVCNFNPPSQGKPSLLTPSEVTTYFHRFGHAMHAICSTAKVQMFWGTHVERDFVEAPSQMLENWVKEKVILPRMSGHYKTGEPIPAEEVEKLNLADKANAGYLNLRQIVLATFDQRIHRSGSVSPRQVYSDVMFEILGVMPHPDTFFPGTFLHVMQGYDAGYYSYLWSEVFSADMYDGVFGKSGPLDADAGLKYRRMILEKGGSVDAIDMIRNFLGREPNQEAFLKRKGVLKMKTI